MHSFTARIAHYDIIQYHLERFMGCEGCNETKFLRKSRNGGHFCCDCFCDRCHTSAKVERITNCRMCDNCFGVSILFKERNPTKFFRYALRQKRPGDKFTDVLDVSKYYFDNETVEALWCTPAKEKERIAIPITARDNGFVEKVMKAFNPPNETLNFSIGEDVIVIDASPIYDWGAPTRIEEIYDVCRRLVHECGYYWRFTLPIMAPYVEEFLNLREMAGIN